jgi:hypothetical protein
MGFFDGVFLSDEVNANPEPIEEVRNSLPQLYPVRSSFTHPREHAPSNIVYNESICTHSSPFISINHTCLLDEKAWGKMDRNGNAVLSIFCVLE